MKSKKSCTKAWKDWRVPIILAVVTGCFLILNTLVSNAQRNKAEPVQSVNEQKVDSGTINNYIAIDRGWNNDTTVKPPIKKPNNKPLKDSNNKAQSTITGDNNIVIQGNNNTVNKYGLEINRPKISDIKTGNSKGKYTLPYSVINYTSKDSLFKTVLDFKYFYQLRARYMIIGFENAREVKFIDFHYVEPGMYTISKENFRNINGDPGIKVYDPLSGNIRVEIYSEVEYSNFRDKLVVLVDSFVLRK